MRVCDRVIPRADVIQKRRQILRAMPRELDSDELARVIQQYDSLFLGNAIARYLASSGNDVTVEISDFGRPGQTRPFGDGGSTIDTDGIAGHSHVVKTPGGATVHCIFISRPLTHQTTNECTNGFACTSPGECLLLILEHELAHLLIDAVCPELENGHGHDFESLVHRLFAHTETAHRLGTSCAHL